MQISFNNSIMNFGWRWNKISVTRSALNLLHRYWPHKCQCDRWKADGDWKLKSTVNFSFVIICLWEWGTDKVWNTPWRRTLINIFSFIQLTWLSSATLCVQKQVAATELYISWLPITQAVSCTVTVKLLFLLLLLLFVTINAIKQELIDRRTRTG